MKNINNNQMETFSETFARIQNENILDHKIKKLCYHYDKRCNGAICRHCKFRND